MAPEPPWAGGCEEGTAPWVRGSGQILSLGTRACAPGLPGLPHRETLSTGLILESSAPSVADKCILKAVRPWPPPALGSGARGP